MKKRMLALLLTLVLLVSLIPVLRTDVQAAGLALDQLKAKYPNGSYWNHYVNTTNDAADYLKKVYNESYSESLSGTICASHTNGNLSYYVGKYDCNYFDGGIQCCGFARKLAYDAYGTRASKWGTSSTVKPGDVVWFKSAETDSTYGHWVFVYAVSGKNITVGECNIGSNRCQIRWGHTYNMSNFSQYTIYSAPYSLPLVSEKLDVGDDFYARIKSVSAQKYLTAVNNNVVISSYNGSDDQIWFFDRQSDGTYCISAANGRVMDVYDASAAANANVQTWAYNGTNAQKWYLTADERGYTFGAMCTGCVMDVYNSDTADGTNVIMWNNAGTDNQRFTLEVIPDMTNIPRVAAERSIYSLGETINIYWDNIPGTTHYWIKIYKDHLNGELVVNQSTQLTRTFSYTPTVRGTYVVLVEACRSNVDCGQSQPFRVLVAEHDNPFSDVAKGSFYYGPVLWALDNNITAGADATHFDPNGKCLRAQVVTFLHRAAGSPEPTSTKNPFKDVKSSHYYYKPVLWAAENKIAAGISSTEFGAKSNCNRASVVTFLWRAAGSPKPKTTSSPFEDVKPGNWFYDAVLWAVENNITAGVDDTHFGPTADCNRAQVVTFLYRAYN